RRWHVRRTNCGVKRGLRTIAMGMAVPAEQTFKHVNASREECRRVSFDCSGPLNDESTNIGILLERHCQIQSHERWVAEARLAGQPECWEECFPGVPFFLIWARANCDSTSRWQWCHLLWHGHLGRDRSRAGRPCHFQMTPLPARSFV